MSALVVVDFGFCCLKSRWFWQGEEATPESFDVVLGKGVVEDEGDGGLSKGRKLRS